ncbi:hypothetical protein NEOLEDRAFT_1149175 [Neolentinus lepideus HHB14362 ss-1]|uniref:Uncharacterized protein n=1 Tax=Neolentinus lepideus HHB14362 ss-1 TaxID=1314782 RepID=A0A165RDD5_9AGAM|nr:hypothetical protein NEOLEDRAFT_1149175 [Neolentinus lepideus HHB14362 ss-1]
MVEEYPYPLSPPDTSIFEEDTTEYSIRGSDTSQPRLSISQPCISDAQRAPSYPLYRAVKEGRYIDADGIRADLLNLGVHIRPDPIYALPALYALQTADTVNRIRVFAAWLSLVPARSDTTPTLTETQDHLKGISDLLLSELDNTDTAQSPDLRIAMAFVMVCISKGYTEHLPFPCTRRIIQLASPEHAAHFLNELVTIHEYEAGPEGVDRSLLTRLYAIAIRAQHWNGRYSLAVQFMKDAAARDIAVDQRTVARLYKYLQAKSLPVPAVLREANVRAPVDTEGVLGLSFEEEDIHRDIDVVAYLRKLRRTLTSPYPPSAKAIANFLLAYRSMRRSHAVELLYNRAIRRTITTRTWAMAEMIYYLHRRKPVYALVIYSRYFHLTAVPKLLVEDTLRRFTPASRFKVPEGIRKLDPTPADTVYAWRALLDHHGSLKRAEVLYAHLMQKMATARAEISSAESSSASSDVGDEIGNAKTIPTSESQDAAAVKGIVDQGRDVLARLPDHFIPAVPNPRVMLSPYYFLPFIQVLGERATPRRAARIFVDMATLGIEPDIYNYTALAGVYAAAGRSGRCLMILDQLESWASNVALGDGEDEQALPYILRPTLATYTTVLRGLVDSRRLPGALLVRRKLVERFNYVYGTDWRTDRALDLLHALQQLDKGRKGVDAKIPAKAMDPWKEKRKSNPPDLLDVTVISASVSVGSSVNT